MAIVFSEQTIFHANAALTTAQRRGKPRRSGACGDLIAGSSKATKRWKLKHTEEVSASRGGAMLERSPKWFLSLITNIELPWQLRKHIKLNADVYRATAGVLILILIFYFFTDSIIARIEAFIDYSHNNQEKLFDAGKTIFGIVLFATFTIQFVRRYSKNVRRNVEAGTRVARPKQKSSDDPLENISRKLNYLMGHLQTKSIELDRPTREEITGAFSAYLERSIPKQVVGELSNKYNIDTAFKEKSNHVFQFIDAAIKDYIEQVERQRGVAAQNLIAGLTIAVAGFVIMGAVTFLFGVIASDSNDRYILYGSRLSLFIAIESIAFFFLKLYRDELSIVRYMRNEITNLQIRRTAADISVSFGKESDISLVIKTLLATERNFVIKKGETVITEGRVQQAEFMLEKYIGVLANMQTEGKQHSLAHEKHVTLPDGRGASPIQK